MVVKYSTENFLSLFCLQIFRISNSKRDIRKSMFNYVQKLLSLGGHAKVYQDSITMLADLDCGSCFGILFIYFGFYADYLVPGGVIGALQFSSDKCNPSYGEKNG